MTDRVQEQLLGHLLGALEESEQQQITARLRSDAELRRELSQVRGRLELLEAGRYDFVPPPGLAERTCRLVAAEAGPAAVAPRPPASRQPATPVPSVQPEYAQPSGQVARFRWLDVAVAAGIFAAASLLLAPAIQSSRFNAQLVACQDNLRHVAVGMLDYSQLNGGYFPCASPGTDPAAGRISAGILVRDGFLPDWRWFVCPGSPAAGEKGPGTSLGWRRTAASERPVDLPRWMDRSYAYHLGHLRDGVCRGTKNLGRTYFALGSDTPGSDPSNGRQSLNHGGLGQNVLLESGAVRFVTSSQPFPQADDIFANRRGLVAPGVDVNDSVIGPPIGLLRKY